MKTGIHRGWTPLHFHCNDRGLWLARISFRRIHISLSNTSRDQWNPQPNRSRRNKNRRAPGYRIPDPRNRISSLLVSTKQDRRQVILASTAKRLHFILATRRAGRYPNQTRRLQKLPSERRRRERAIHLRPRSHLSDLSFQFDE